MLRFQLDVLPPHSQPPTVFIIKTQTRNTHTLLVNPEGTGKQQLGTSSEHTLDRICIMSHTNDVHLFFHANKTDAGGRWGRGTAILDRRRETLQQQRQSLLLSDSYSNCLRFPRPTCTALALKCCLPAAREQLLFHAAESSARFHTSGKYTTTRSRSRNVVGVFSVPC